jgi:hypothetical protein
MVSDVAILIADALRAFLTAKVVFLEEHGSVAWSGSARSELADLCLLSALTPDVERRKYSAVGSISHLSCRAPAAARLWHSVTGPGGLRWVSA